MKKRNVHAHDNLLVAGQFFGATRVQLQTDEFVVTAVTHAQGRVVPPHVHAHPFFSMLVSGQYREWFGRDHWDARPLGMVLRPSQAEHRDEIGPAGAAFLCIDIAPAYWRALADVDLAFERRAYEGRPMSFSALRLFGELVGRRPGWQQMAEALITELIEDHLREAHPVGPREPRWLRRVYARLREEPLAVTPRSLARELDLHPVHVARMFKRHTGMTLSQHLRHLRLHYATRTLLETEAPLAQLAGEHGFSDQSHLTRELTRVARWTPARLRCACEDLR